MAHFGGLDQFINHPRICFRVVDIRRAFAIEYHYKTMQQRIGGQFRLGRLAGNTFQQFRHNFIEQCGAQSVSYRFGYDKKRTPDRIVNPIIRSAAQAEAFARNIAPGGRMASLHAQSVSQRRRSGQTRPPCGCSSFYIGFSQTKRIGQDLQESRRRVGDISTATSALFLRSPDKKQK